MHTCGRASAMAYMWRSGKTGRTQFCPSIICMPGLELRSFGLAASPFALWAILPALFLVMRLSDRIPISVSTQLICLDDGPVLVGHRGECLLRTIKPCGVCASVRQSWCLPVHNIPWCLVKNSCPDFSCVEKESEIQDALHFYIAFSKTGWHSGCPHRQHSMSSSSTDR